MKIMKNLFNNSGQDSENKPEMKKDEHQHSHKEDNISAKRYYCPMKCEGDKIYDSPGRCPVCNMKLVPVTEENQVK